MDWLLIDKSDRETVSEVFLSTKKDMVVELLKKVKEYEGRRF